MYSNKENVNILTALLVAHGVRHVVVCPGSRNAPIVHNLNECPEIQCYPVTDERSAGFYALGMAQATREPVAVCVTSGTALLNLAPAVAEAYYQHHPLVVISADRPRQWIDQLDGQTLPQEDALGRFVRKAVTLPEPHNDEERWYCQRLVQEALLVCDRPVHINVPISEPLFEFTEHALPPVRRILKFYHGDSRELLTNTVFPSFLCARRPMIVFGQMNNEFMPSDYLYLQRHAVVLHESLFCRSQSPVHFDEVLYTWGDHPDLLPDSVIYIGGTLVSKRLKQFLRRAVDATFIRVSSDGDLVDTFMHLDYLVEAEPYELLGKLDDCCRRGSFLDEILEKDMPLEDTTDYVSRWDSLLQKAASHAENYIPAYSQMLAVRCLERELQRMNPMTYQVHYANSSAIRLANIYAHHRVWCNRGVNGIEGSLSVAAGYSITEETAPITICVIGDLSFFYDQNALWNQNLRGNFRVLLLNNGRGGIFNMLQGLERSDARNSLVAASHHTSAEGICRQNGIGYRKAIDVDGLQQGIEWLLYSDSDHPLLLEVLTDVDEDSRVLKEYYQQE